MSKPLRIYLFNPDAKMPLREPFESMENAIIAGPYSNWDEFKDLLWQADIDVIVVNLDSGDGLGIIERITVTSPSCSVIGISSKTDPITIIKAMRAGCSQFVPWPVDMQDLKEAIERIRSARSVTVNESKLIYLIGASGGVGVTTIACNLATEMGHLLDQQCALVDMNLEFGDIGCAFDIQTMYSVADLCANGIEADSIMLDKAFHALPSKVSVLVRPETPEEAQNISPEGFANMIAVAKQVFPIIIIDLPRSLSFLSNVILHDQDKILIISQLNVSCIRNTTRIKDFMHQIGIPNENIEIVLNRCKADFANLTPEDVEGHFGKKIFGMIPNDYKRVQSARDLGHPVIADDSNSPARAAINEIARKLASDHITIEETASPSKGFLSRLWKKTPQSNESGTPTKTE